MRRQVRIEGLNWRPGRGWLVLVGGTTGRWAATDAIDRAAIEAMQAGKPVAFLPAADCPPDYGASFLATYAALGAPPGYVVPVHDAASARDPTNARLLREAGLIYIGGGETPRLLASVTDTPSLDAMASAYEAGAVIVGMSAGAIALAEWGLSIDPRVGLLRGWGWLPHAIVAPHYTANRSPELASALEQHPRTVGLGLPEHVALALGPEAEMETWGDGKATVIPGQ